MRHHLQALDIILHAVPGLMEIPLPMRSELCIYVYIFQKTAKDDDVAAADACGAIIAHSGYSRRKLLDRMIAAQAIIHHAVLVTMNPDVFADIVGLRVLTW